MKFIWRVCVVAAMGGLLFGYDWVVVGGAKAFYESFFSISDDMLFRRGFAMSSALFGCIAGAILSGSLADRLGRKRLLISSGLLFTVSAIWTGLSWDFFSYNFARIIGGVGIGLASNLSPMYIAEVSPAAMRGKLVSINQLTIVIGILAAQIVNMVIAQPVPTADQLRLLVNESSASAAMGHE
ncbi:MFS transporter, partial [bacterium]